MIDHDTADDGRGEDYEITPGEPAVPAEGADQESLLAIEMIDDGDEENPYFSMEPLGMVESPPPKVLQGWRESPESRLGFTYVLKAWEANRCAIYREAGLQG
jgi:hypothetical protein